MIPHISLTEILEGAGVMFVLGAVTGTWIIYKIDGVLRRRFGKKG